MNIIIAKNFFFLDYFFFCHAGVSQWMTCRANIANIPRPTDLNNMKILEGCIITDILWSDPKPNQKLLVISFQIFQENYELVTF